MTGETTPRPWGAELSQLVDWLAGTPRLALATVIATWGSSPLSAGSHMVIRPDQGFAGSVSGGCIEGEVIRSALEVIEDGVARVLNFSVTDGRAWEVGLSCGGAIDILVEAVDRDHPLVRSMEVAPAPSEAWRLVSLARGRNWMIGGDGGSDDGELPADLAQEVGQAVAAGGCAQLGKEYFLQHYRAPIQLYVVGAVHVAQHLIPMARRCGLAPTVIDPRRGFATEERFPQVCVVSQWPDRFFQARPLCGACALVTLTHDPKIDDPALCAALKSEAFYIGALGSRKTHADRLERLLALGYEEGLDRIHGPVGLDLGGRAPAEIALSILSQVVHTRYRGGRHGKA